MDFVVRKVDLLKELQYVQGVVEKKNTVPILSNLLLETTGNSLVIIATDLDVSIRCSCPAAVKVSGSLTISARKLFDIVRLLPESDVHFKGTDRDWVQITCERSKFKIAGLSKENFPDIPLVNGKSIHLPAPVLRYMIVHSIFAITQEESRYSLNGALMIIKAGNLTLVTTDGHRLALITRNIEVSGLTGEIRVLVPKKTLVELSKLAAEDFPTLQFGYTENHLFFEIGKRLLVSRVLVGQFPNYEMVIPKDNHRKVVVNTADVTDALRRAAIMADEQSRAVRLSVKEGQIDISASYADVGEAREVLSANYTGDPLDIGFNAQYLLDFLSGLESDEVVFELRDEDTAGLLQPKAGEEYAYHYVIMPMKL